ncbi:hypothetical protein REPUB_Repub11eG0126300 [Reevesia pubescens]
MASLSSSEIDGATSKMWSKIWNAMVPTKIKNFSLKVALDYFSVYWNLNKRKIDVCVVCPRCVQSEETTHHAPRDCSFAEECWKQSGLMEVWKLDETQSMEQCLSAVANTLNQSSFDKGMVLAWAIWGSRNEEVNFDRAICETEGLGGAGVVIRDGEVLVVRACSMFHPGLRNPEIMEASAAVDALTFAADMGFQKIIVEKDAT